MSIAVYNRVVPVVSKSKIVSNLTMYMLNLVSRLYLLYCILYKRYYSSITNN